MFVFRRFFARDDKFYRLLEASATEVRNGASALGRLIAGLNQGPIENILSEIDQCRRRHKRLAQEITEQIMQTFATSFEREDIESLSAALYKISKTIEKIGERTIICPPGVNVDSIRRQIALLEQGAAVLTDMVGYLAARSHVERMRDCYERIQAIEGDADRIMNELLRDLYLNSQFDARTVVFWKDIYELVEKGIDRCRDAASVLFHVVLKNS